MNTFEEPKFDVLSLDDTDIMVVSNENELPQA